MYYLLQFTIVFILAFIMLLVLCRCLPCVMCRICKTKVIKDVFLRAHNLPLRRALRKAVRACPSLRRRGPEKFLFSQGSVELEGELLFRLWGAVIRIYLPCRARSLWEHERLCELAVDINAGFDKGALSLELESGTLVFSMPLTPADAPRAELLLDEALKHARSAAAVVCRFTVFCPRSFCPDIFNPRAALSA